MYQNSSLGSHVLINSVNVSEDEFVIVGNGEEKGDGKGDGKGDEDEEGEDEYEFVNLENWEEMGDWSDSDDEHEFDLAGMSVEGRGRVGIIGKGKAGADDEDEDDLDLDRMGGKGWGRVGSRRF